MEVNLCAGPAGEQPPRRPQTFLPLGFTHDGRLATGFGIDAWRRGWAHEVPEESKPLPGLQEALAVDT